MLLLLLPQVVLLVILLLGVWEAAVVLRLSRG